MSKLFFPLLFTLVLCLNSFAQGLKIFPGTLDDAKTEAFHKHKLIFIDCWENGCYPCILMEKKGFTDSSVAVFFNAHFINLKRNMFTDDSAGISNVYDIHIYPTLLFLDAKGNVIHFAVGFSNAAALLKTGQTAIDSANNSSGLQKRFNAGETDTAFLIKYIKSVSAIDQESAESALKKYWESVSDSDFYLPENFNLFWRCENDINSRAFNFMYDHKNKFITKFFINKDYSKEGPYARVALMQDSDFVFMKAAEAVKIALDKKDYNTYKKARRIAFESKYDEPQYIAIVTEYPYCNWEKDWSNYFEDVDRYFAKFPKRRSRDYNAFAWNIVENTDDSVALKKALEYVNLSIGYERNYANVDTWANILYKLGQYKKAYSAATEALELGKKSHENTSSTEELMQKLKGKLGRDR